MHRSPTPVASNMRSRFYAAEDGGLVSVGGHVARGSGVVEFALDPSMVRVSPAAIATSYRAFSSSTHPPLPLLPPPSTPSHKSSSDHSTMAAWALVLVLTDAALSDPLAFISSCGALPFLSFPGHPTVSLDMDTICAVVPCNA